MQIPGAPIARQIQDELRLRVAELPVRPRLAIVHLSPDRAADIYVGLKQRFGESIGVAVEVLRPATGELEAVIARLNTDPGIHGIIIQLPLPQDVSTLALLAQVDPVKDVDGLNPDSSFVTAGPRGIMELLAAYRVELSGARVALLGTGQLMGRRLQQLLVAAGAQVEAFNLERPPDPTVLRRSGIIIGATGQRFLITSRDVAAGSVVIDATGVDTDPALQRRDDIRITPTTGGVGPMTVAALFENLLEATVAAVQNHHD
jgi:methylenetetrahydrofolate dehydrogenase (NADP+)/methenyltetrahydrofolate cyclohydrolase